MTANNPWFTLNNPSVKKVHHFALVLFAAMLGLFEGPAEIFCVVVLVTTLFVGGYSRPPNKSEKIILAALLLWGLIGLYGTLTSTAHLSSEDKFRPLLALALFVGVRAVAPSDDKTLGRMAWAFIGALVLNGAYGYLQVIFHQLPLDHWLIKNRMLGQLVVPGHYDLRAASGFFYNRLKLAHIGIIALGLIGLILITKKPPLARRSRILGLVGGLLLGGAVILTYARMALVACAGAAVVLLLLLLPLPRFKKSAVRLLVVTGAVLGLVVIVLAVSPHNLERITKPGGDLAVRINIQRSALKMWRDHPMVGVGHGAYRTEAKRYAHDETYRGPRLVDGHSLYIHTLAETGIVGFIGFGAILCFAALTLIRRVRRDRAKGSARVLLDRAALFTLSAYLALGVFHFPLHHATVALLFWLAVGIAVNRSRDGGCKEC